MLIAGLLKLVTDGSNDFVNFVLAMKTVLSFKGLLSLAAGLITLNKVVVIYE